MITVKTRNAKEAFKGHIDNVQELKKELLKQLPESELWDDLGKRDELHCTMPATRGLNPIKSIVGSILANSVLDADVKVEKAAGTDDWIYVSITKIREDLNKMQAFEQVSVEDLRGWGDEEVANQNALSSIAEAIKQSFNEADIKYSDFDFDIFSTGSTICIHGIENTQEAIEFLEEHFEFPIVDEGEDYIVIDCAQEYKDENGNTQERVNTNYLSTEEPDEDAKKLARIKEEIYYYLGREVSDEEALEVLEFAEAKPYADLSEIVSDYFNQ